MVTVYSAAANNVVENVVENGVENVVEKESKTATTILNLISQNKNISASKIAQLAGISVRTVQRYLNMFQKQGSIKHIGPDRGGYWELSGKT